MRVPGRTRPAYLFDRLDSDIYRVASRCKRAVGVVMCDAHYMRAVQRVQDMWPNRSELTPFERSLLAINLAYVSSIQLEE